MSTGKLQIILTVVLVLVAGLAFLAVDFVNVRSTAKAEKPGFAQYVSGMVATRPGEDAVPAEAVETVAEVPAVEDDTAEAKVAALGDDVVTRGAFPSPGSWFSRGSDASDAKVEFTCVMGPGGSKVCTADTMKR